MAIRTLTALALAVMVGIAALAVPAEARTCNTYCYGNSCTTTCF